MKVHAAAVGAALGAWWAAQIPLLVVIAAVCVVARWPRAFFVGAAMLLATSFLAARAVAGLDPVSPGPVEGWVTLADDPRPLGPTGVAVTVRHEGRLLDAVAHGAAAARLDDRLAGEAVLIEGTTGHVHSTWARWRHVVGRLTINGVRATDSAAPAYAGANRIRHLLVDGAASLSRSQRSLFTGMVIGDDRNQSAVTADDFRAAGLGHLLVVSGQNVAFVLALASPATARLRPGGRLLAVLVILAVFAVLTRFEPSVLRAVVMAGLAVGSAVLGRPADGRRVLAGAVAALLAIDPFLVHVLAFQLSVAATAGIVWLAPGVAAALPGPRPLALAFATTVAAQVAVTPILVGTFGSVPVAALPANLLAGPISGPVMMWGATGGVLAGVFGGAVAEAIHWPTTAMLWWIEGVARAAARAPAVALGPVSGGIVCASTVALILSGPGRRRRLAVLTVVAVIGLSVTRTPVPRPGWSSLDGASIWSGDATIAVLETPRSPQRLLESLRTAGVGRPDLVVAATGGAADAHAVVSLTDRFGELPVLAPPLHRVPGARTARPGQKVEIEGALLEVVSVRPELEITVEGSGPPGASARLAGRPATPSGRTTRRSG